MNENENSPNLMGEVVAGPKGLSIRIKLALVIAGLVTLALGLLSGFVLRETRQALLQEATRRGLIIGRNLADYSASAVTQRDPLPAAQFTKDALSDDAVMHAVLTDENKNILAIRAATSESPAVVGGTWTPLEGQPFAMDGLPSNILVVESTDPVSGKDVLAFAIPVIKADVQVGNAYIALSQEKVRKVMQDTTLKVAVLAAGFLLLALAAAFGLANVIVRPVQKLTKGALAIGGGALDTQIDVTTQDELGVLAKSFNAMTAGLRRAQKEMVEGQLLKQELNIAQEIQQGLLPKKIPVVPGYEIAAFYMPAKEVGGDYYDFIKTGENLALSVADVSGKSVPGALGMTMARAVLRVQAFSGAAPVEIIRKTNEIIQPDIRKGMFVTMFFAVLDPRAHTLSCANAGHNPVFLVRGGEVQEIGPEGLALGLVPAHQYFVEGLVVDLKPGDFVAFYTDGVTEAMNGASQEYGEDRFKDVLIKVAGQPMEGACAAILDDVKAFVAGAPPHDDITLVLLRRKA